MIKRYREGEKLSRIVVHNDTVYLCGQVANDYEADVSEQTRQVLARIDEHLAEVGSDKNKMLSCIVYVKNAADLPLVNKEWGEWLKNSPKPSRTGVIADLANEKILVEISVVAAK